VLGRKLPTEQEANPKVYAIRLFARNKVVAKSKFWYHLRRQLKTKSAQGQILSVNEIFERRPSFVKTFGIIVRYQSRTANHNMYKEYRDVSLNGAISQLHADMAGNHRASPDTISIIRTAVLHKKDEIRRPKSVQYRQSDLKFPILRTATRASHKRYRSIFRANRPSTFHQ
jgi:large subunit ribosomal protein L18Ae